MAERSKKAIAECADWLAACLRGGWSKSELDVLERMWWEHHDERGNLVRQLGDDAKP